MVHGLGIHRAHEADVIRESADVRQHGAHLGAALAVAFEGLDGRCDGPFFVAGRHGGEACGAAHAVGDVLPGHVLQHGLGIKKIDMRGTAALPEAHDTLRLRREVRESRQTDLSRVGAAFTEQRGERYTADALRGAAKQLPSVDTLLVEMEIVKHGGGVSDLR